MGSRPWVIAWSVAWGQDQDGQGPWSAARIHGHDWTEGMGVGIGGGQVVGQLGSYRSHILGTLPKSKTSGLRTNFQGFLEKSIDPQISTEIAYPWFLRHFQVSDHVFVLFAKLLKSPKSTKMVLCGISESAPNARIPALCVFRQIQNPLPLWRIP